MDADADDGAGSRTPHPGQRYRSRPDPAEPAPEPPAVPSAMPRDAAPTRHRARRDRRGAALHSCRAGDDRADDRTRWRAASRLGAAAAERRGRMTCDLNSAWRSDKMSRLSRGLASTLSRALEVVHNSCDLTMT